MDSERSWNNPFNQVERVSFPMLHKMMNGRFLSRITVARARVSRMILRILQVLPAVNERHFAIDRDAHLIAHLEESRMRRIMRGPDEIDIGGADHLEVVPQSGVKLTWNAQTAMWLPLSGSPHLGDKSFNESLP